MGRQALNGRRIDPCIGDQLIDLLDRGNLKIGDDAPLAGICDNEDLALGALDHLLDHLRFRIGRHGASMQQADPIHAQDRLVRIDLAQVVDRKTSCHRIGMRLEFTPDQVMFKSGIPHFEGNIQIIAEDRDPGISPDVPDHLGRGGPAVDENDIAILNEGGRHFSDGSLYFGKPLGPLQVLGLQCHPLAEHGSPMCPFDNAFVFHPLQVAPDGRFRGIQHEIQIVDPGDFMDCQIALDSFAPLSWNKRFAH